ncbi:MAG: segregation/condensation protein A [Firmicutes bacterium]|nr:segregation/condensation protein A [Bacillota bacterium]
MAYQVRLDNFSGPFDLLCHLIENAELDICAISLTQVVDQYVSYVTLAEDYTDLDAVGEFLVLATRLLLIKTQVLLPITYSSEPDQGESDDIDDTEELVQHLRQYRVFRDLGRQIGKFMEQEKTYIPVGCVPVEGDEQVEVMNPPHIKLYDIVSAWTRLAPLFNQPQTVTIFPDRPTVEEEISALKIRLKNQPSLSFNHYLGKNPTRLRLVTVLLAVLELWRQDNIRVWQVVHFGDIFVASKEVGTCTNNP